MSFEKYSINITQKMHYVDANTIAIKTIKERFCLKGVKVSLLVKDVLECFNSPASVDSAVSVLSAKYSADTLKKIIQLLIDKSVLLEHDQSTTLIGCDKILLDKTIFYTLGNMPLNDVISKLGVVRIGIISTKQLAASLFANLADSGLLKLFTVGITDSDEKIGLDKSGIDVAELSLRTDFTQLELLVNNSDFVVVGSNYYDHRLFEEVNKICYSNGTKWLRVVVDGFKAEIGPIVIPSRTCCYACMRTRNINNMSTDEYIFDGIYQKQSEEREVMEYNSLYPMYSIVAGISSCEIIKSHTNMLCNLFNQVITIDCVDFKVQIDRVYKDYSCIICGRKDALEI